MPSAFNPGRWVRNAGAVLATGATAVAFWWGFGAPGIPHGSAISYYVSSVGSDTNPGTQSQPFATLTKAYQVASCGQTIEVLNGSYGSMSLGHSVSAQNTDAKACTNPVTFQGESTAGVMFTDLVVGEPWVTVTNVTTKSLEIEGWDSTVGCYTNPVSNVTFANSVIDGQNASVNPMSMTNVQHITVSNTSIGNVTTGETEIHASGITGCPQTDHLTFFGDTWHDFKNPTGSNSHMECLQLDALVSGTANTNVTLDSNRFENCGQYDVFISGQANNWTVQNNFFDTPCSNQTLASPVGGTNGCIIGGGAISMTSGMQTWIGQFNTFATGTYPQFSVVAGTESGNVWRYNIDGTFPDSTHCGAQDNWALTSNLDSGPVTCTGDTNGTPTFVSAGPASYDYDQTAGSIGIDFLSPCPATAPAADIHGAARPASGKTACNVGASQENG